LSLLKKMARSHLPERLFYRVFGTLLSQNASMQVTDKAYQESLDCVLVEKAGFRKSLNRLCNEEDWLDSRFLSLCRDLKGDEKSRKMWEYARTIIGLEDLNALCDESVVLSVGAGQEKLLYYLSNRIKRVIGIDLYDDGFPHEADSNFLANVWKSAPFHYNESNLEVRRMDACNLEFESNTFDVVYSLSSIEHFGGYKAAGTCMREVERVLKPGGICCIATEYCLNRKKYSEFIELFSRQALYDHVIHSHGMDLAGGDIDWTMTKNTFLSCINLHDRGMRDRLPHIVLIKCGCLFTSVILFFRKAS